MVGASFLFNVFSMSSTSTVNLYHKWILLLQTLIPSGLSLVQFKAIFI